MPYCFRYAFNVVVDSSYETEVAMSRYCLRKLGKQNVPLAINFNLKMG